MLIGVGSMVGAGVFVVFAPAAAAAGTALLVGLAVAAAVAYCNATSSARLAARYPESGGSYLYGRRQLGELWGYLAGWSFVVGKTASCAAMALTAGVYLWPAHAHAVAVAAVVALTAVNYRGIQKSAALTRVIVAVTLSVLAAVVVLAFGSGAVQPDRISVTGGSRDALAAAGLLFFAFAGYARIATLGEEVRDPDRVIPRAIAIALAITLLVYAGVAVTLLAVLGTQRLASSADPLAEVVRACGASGMEPAVRAGAVVAALGSLLSLILGVSRTTLAMARDGHLPAALAAVHPRFGVPHRAEVAVGAAVAVLAAVADLRGAIGFSSFTVLLYYSIANASAFRLARSTAQPLRRHAVPVLGLTGCLLLAGSLPPSAVAAGAVVVAAGAGVYGVRRFTASR